VKSHRKELPPVDKGIPLPLVKYHPKTRASKSRWVDYLLALQPGDSFVIQKGETQTVMIQAKRLDMFITWRVVENGVRVWLVPEDKVPEKPKRKWLKDEKRQVPFPAEQTPASPEPPQPAPVPKPEPPAEDDMMSLL
jgi:hypothetical protein